jgi:hypothetical protein
MLEHPRQTFVQDDICDAPARTARPTTSATVKTS